MKYLTFGGVKSQLMAGGNLKPVIKFYNISSV